MSQVPLYVALLHRAVGERKHLPALNRQPFFSSYTLIFRLPEPPTPSIPTANAYAGNLKIIREETGSAPPTRWSLQVSFTRDFELDVTTFAPNKALKLIA